MICSFLDGEISSYFSRVAPSLRQKMRDANFTVASIHGVGGLGFGCKDSAFLFRPKGFVVGWFTPFVGEEFENM